MGLHGRGSPTRVPLSAGCATLVPSDRANEVEAAGLPGNRCGSRGVGEGGSDESIDVVLGVA